MSRQHAEHGYPLMPRQRAAAERSQGQLFVVGGPSTGKAHIIVARIAYLLGNGVAPDEITCLMARPENVANLRRMLALHPTVSEYGNSIRLFTVDQYANLILRAGGATQLGLFPHYSIWDRTRAAQATTCAPGVAGQSDVKDRDIRSALDWHWRNISRFPDDPHLPAQDDRWLDIVSKYVGEKRSQRALDIPDLADLVIRVIELIRRDDPTWRMRGWRHLLVDQVEELNGRQLAMLDLMVDFDGSLTLTSDPNQGPSACSFDCLREFWRSRYAKLEVVHLVQVPIGSERLHNLAKDLQLSGGMTGLGDDERRWIPLPGPAPRLVKVEGTFRDMVGHCLAEIKDLIDGGMRYDEIAVLYRKPGVIDRMRTGLSHLKIPYRAIGEPWRERPTDARCVVAMLTTLVNPMDLPAVAVAAAVGHPNQSRRLSSPTCETLSRLAQDREVDLVEVARKYAKYEENRDVPDLEQFVRNWDFLREAMERPECALEHLLASAEVLAQAASDSDLTSGFGEMKKNSAWLWDTFSKMRAREGENLQDHLVRFLDAAASTLGHVGEYEDDHGVTIGTIAAAKGLRWRVVIILDVSDRTMPGDVYGNRLEQEQRLFFTAVTRATDQLHMYCLADTGQGNSPIPSRFLEPIANRLECTLVVGIETANKVETPSVTDDQFALQRFGEAPVGNEERGSQDASCTPS